MTVVAECKRMVAGLPRGRKRKSAIVAAIKELHRQVRMMIPLDAVAASELLAMAFELRVEYGKKS